MKTCNGVVRIRVNDQEKEINFSIEDKRRDQNKIESDLEAIEKLVISLPVEIERVASRWMVFYFQDFYILLRVRGRLQQGTIRWAYDHNCELQTSQRYHDGIWELWVRKIRGRYDLFDPTVEELIDNRDAWEAGIRSYYDLVDFRKEKTRSRE